MSVRKTRGEKRWRRRSLLLILCCAFGLSGVLRLGTLEVAWASTPDSGAAPIAIVDAEMNCPMTAPVEEALAMIRERAEFLDAREAELNGREQAVIAARALIEDRLAALEETEARLQALLAMSDSAAETDLQQLTQLYETMDPESAAPLFEQMDVSFAAGFLSRMRPEAGAAILAELPPETAYSISVLLATRNATAPRFSEPVPTEN